MRILVKSVALLFILMVFSCDKTDESVDTTETIDPTDPLPYQQYGDSFTGLPATEDIVMYEANLRAMSPAGNIQGVIDKLDHIKSLGVNVLWLMPIHPQGVERSVGSPYAVRDYKAVSPEYGNLQDLRRLTDAAHARGIAVIMDWVANHTAWDNQWIQNKSWYAQDANGNIIIPPGTNFQDVAELNYSNAAMRVAMIDAMEYWIYEANVDGYRCDYANGVPGDFWQQAWNKLDAIPNRKLIKLAEGDRADLLSSGFDMNFGFKFYSGIKAAFEGQSASTIFSEAAIEDRNVPAGKKTVRYTTNHDVSAFDKTPVQLYGGKQGSLSAFAITTFIDGVPLIYSSQEVGRSNNLPFFTKSLIDFSANPDMLETYQKIMSFYNSSNVSRSGTLQTFANDDLAVFKKTLNGDEVLIIANIRNRQIDYTLPAGLSNTSWKNVLNQNDVTLNSQVNLQAYEFLILD